MANLIFPTWFEEKTTIAQDDMILMADSEDNNRIKKWKYCNLKWEPWTAATINVWSVCTWAAWSSVCIVNSWTCTAAVLDFTIPKWDKWDTGCTWPAIICAEFNWNDIDFTEENWNVVTLTDAKLCLKWDKWDTWCQWPQGCQWPQWCTWPQGCTWPTWNGICCAVLNADYTLTLQYTNGCCDTTWSIRWEQWPQGCTWATWCTWPEWPRICAAAFSGDDIEFTETNGCSVTLADAKVCLQWPQWCQWPIWCTWATWNWICCMTSTKAWKVTTVELQYTCWWSDCFSVCDWQDWQWAWDMLACVYDPNGCAKNVFDYDNLDNTPDLSCYQEKLTVWNWIDITSNTISTTFIYWESSTAAATVQKEVSIPSITSLNVWQVIIVKPTVTSTVASSTLKLNSFPAYKMLYNGAEISTSTDSIVWWANVPSMFYLDEVSGTKYWRFLGHWLDSNTTYTLNRLIDPSRYKVWTGTYAFSRYSLVMEKADWTREKITNTAAAYSTWTSKTVNTNWFRLWHIRYYNTTTNVANWALVAASAIDIQAPSVNASYSFNCGTTPWWAVWTPIYLVGSMWADWLFYLDTTQRWSTTLPNTNDWKLYIKLWTSLSADNSTFSLITEKPIFYYDNWIKIYQQADNKQDKISDLDTIRTWAACWASALQSINCWDVTTALWYTPAQSCDIPTDNCQLANGCWYTTCTWTLSSCSDITTALWFTPYSCANPCGYTTCTGTLSSCSDITTTLWYTPANYADFETATTVWATLTVSYFTTQITPSANFTIVAWAVKEWMQYIVRVNSWATAYTMSLWTWVTNPFGEDLTLTANKMTTIVMLATSSSTLEIFSILTAE